MAEELESKGAITDEQPNKDGDVKKLLADAKARFELAKEAEAEIRRLALEDLKFRAGEQWPQDVQQDRERDGRPCLVINRIPQFIQQVTNDQRQNRPSIKVHPVDDQADVETAKVIQGLIRHIEYNSNADVAYDTAFEGAATHGFGYFRIVTEYSSPTSFDQEILIKRIRNPFSVFFDPYSQEPDGSDANFVFIVEDLSKDEYKARYPESKLSTEQDWNFIGNTAPGWIETNGCRVAEYFYKEFEEREMLLLDNGETVEAEEFAERVAEVQSQPLAVDEMGQEIAPVIPQVMNRRTAKVPVIKWCKTNGIEVLEETQWPGQWIPVIPVYGTELDIDGKRVLEGVVRNAKDPARMYNYWASAETEAIALAPRAPFIGYEGQFEGHEREWAMSNRRNIPYLEVKPVSLNGQPAPLPQRNSFEPAIQAITQARMVSADDIKATTGIYDASLGARSNETSGVAIQSRTMQTQTSNYHFFDNLVRSLKHAGRILVDILPKVYDAPRASRIIGEDGEQKIVKLNQPTGEQGKDGSELLYKLDTGRYDVTVDVGPSFATKRMEAAQTMMDLSRAYPPLMQVAGDLLVKNMDWPGAQDIADRIKKTLPPGIADDPKKGQQIPPQVQAQMAQMSHMVEQLTSQLNQAHDELDKKKLELDSRERIEFAKLQTQAEIEMAKMGSQESIALLKHEIQVISERLKMLGLDQLSAAAYGAPDQGYEQSQQQQFVPQHEAMMDGAIGAAPMPMMADHHNPTGGESPGLPMEGVTYHDDPGTF